MSPLLSCLKSHLRDESARIKASNLPSNLIQFAIRNPTYNTTFYNLKPKKTTKETKKTHKKNTQKNPVNQGLQTPSLTYSHLPLCLIPPYHTPTNTFTFPFESTPRLKFFFHHITHKLFVPTTVCSLLHVCILHTPYNLPLPGTGEHPVYINPSETHTPIGPYTRHQTQE